MNMLDEIYEDYKRKKNNKHSRKLRPIASNGVPEPILEGELEVNDKVHACVKCGSFNLSIDLTTNEKQCNDCKSVSKTSNQIDFQKQMNNLQESEFALIQQAIALDQKFNIT